MFFFQSLDLQIKMFHIQHFLQKFVINSSGDRLELLSIKRSNFNHVPLSKIRVGHQIEKSAHVNYQKSIKENIITVGKFACETESQFSKGQYSKKSDDLLSPFKKSSVFMFIKVVQRTTINK